MFYVSAKFYGLKRLVPNFFNNFVLFIFPLLTSFSFFEIQEVIESENRRRKEKEVSGIMKIKAYKSLPDLYQLPDLS